MIYFLRTWWPNKDCYIRVDGDPVKVKLIVENNAPVRWETVPPFKFEIFPIKGYTCWSTEPFDELDSQ